MWNGKVAIYFLPGTTLKDAGGGEDWQYVGVSCLTEGIHRGEKGTMLSSQNNRPAYVFVMWKLC